MKPRILSTARLSFPLATAIAALLSAQSIQAASQTWGANSNSDWYTAANWAGNAVPGLQGVAASNTDIATFTSAFTGTTVGINMGTNSLNLGAVSIASTRTTATNIGNSGGTAGVLRLYGNTVNGVSNVIVRNAGTGLLTLQATQTGPMGVVLSNSTDNIINIDGSGGVTISSLISESAATRKLTLGGSGTGVLTLNGSVTNTFSGGLNVNAGNLVLDYANIAASTNLITSQVLNFGGGNLTLNGKTGANLTTQAMGNVTVNAGGGTLLIDPNNGTSTTLALGTVTSTAAGSSLTLGEAITANTGTVTITTTSNKNATDIYGGRIIFADGTANTGYDWATTASVSSPYTLSAYSGYSAMAASGTDTLNSRITASSVLGGALTTNTLKIENPAASQSLDLGANPLTLTAGGLLVTGTNAVQVTGTPGNQLTAGNGSGSFGLTVSQFNSGGLDIAAVIGNNGANATALTKAGSGSLTLSGSNTFTGGLFITAGSVTLANPGALNSTAGSENAVTLSNGSVLSLGGNSVVLRSLTSGSFSIVQNANVTPANLTIGNSGNAASTFAGVIQNGTGGGALSLIKAGTNTLTLTNAANTYSGGTVINAGTVSVTADGHLGLAGAGITFNGTARLSAPAVVSTRPITINGVGTLATFIGNGVFTTSGDVTGAGGVFLDGGANAGSDVVLNGTGNTFLGPITIGNVASITAQQYSLTVGSLSDSATANGNIILNYQGTRLNGIFGFYYNNASTTPLTLANRQIVLANTGGTPGNNIANNSSNVSAFLAVNTNLSVTTAAATSLIFGGTNTGANTFAGIIGNGTSPSLSLTKNGIGRWTLSGPNTYTGATAVSAGTLVGIGANAFGSTSGISTAGAGTLSLRGDTNTNFVKASDSSPYTVNNSASGSTINVDRVSGIGAATMTIGNLTTTSIAGTWALNFTGANGVSLSAGALNTPISTAAAVHTITNNITGGGTLTLASVFNQATTIASPDLAFGGTGTTIVSGAITQTQADMDLIKNGAGTLLLNGTNSYTGATTVSAGILSLGSTGSVASSSSVAIAAGASLDTSGQASYAIPTGKPLAFGINATGSGSSGKITAAQLDITNATVTYNITGTPDDPVYVLATYNTLTGGTFLSVPTPPAGYTLNYAYQGNKIALVSATSPYDTWAAGTFTNPFTNTLPGVDFDNDGLGNLMEFVLGGDPTISQAGVAPAVTTSGSNLVMTFKRSDASELAPAVSVKVEISTDLSFSTPADDITIGPATDVGPIAPSGASYTVTNSGGFDTIVLTIPQGAAPKKFARVKAVQP